MISRPPCDPTMISKPIVRQRFDRFVVSKVFMKMVVSCRVSLIGATSMGCKCMQMKKVSDRKKT